MFFKQNALFFVRLSDQIWLSNEYFTFLCQLGCESDTQICFNCRHGQK